MKKMKKLAGMCCAGMVMIAMTMGQASPDGCSSGPAPERADVIRQQQAQNIVISNQETPTDIKYSLVRYNIIRRTYWINGQREKAVNLPCPIVKPIGYVVLLTKGGAVLQTFIVDGCITSLKQYLTPVSEYYELLSNTGTCYNKWLADIDSCYGDNNEGIFFFTPSGNYIEWNGEYLYSDVPFRIKNPVIEIELKNQQ